MKRWGFKVIAPRTVLRNIIVVLVVRLVIRILPVHSRIKTMSGHYGDERVTTRNIKLVKIMCENNLLLINGSVLVRLVVM